MKDPAYMEFDELRELLHRRIMDGDYEDDDLVATRAETCALLAWALQFNQAAGPRREEEQRAFDIIKRAAALLESKDQ